MKNQLTALIIGAFLFIQPAKADEPVYTCPDGGNYSNDAQYGHICSLPSPSGQIYTAYGMGSPLASLEGSGPSVSAAHSDLISKGLARLNANPNNSGSASWTTTDDFGQPTNCSQTWTITHQLNLTNVSGGRQYYNHIQTTSSSISGHSRCGSGDSSDFTQTYNFWEAAPTSTDNYCPPGDGSPLTSMGGTSPNRFCWALAVLLDDCPDGDCDTPPDEECIGDMCGKPDCVQGGGGMLICREKEEDKCFTDLSGNISCESGCGFINESVFCLTEPDDNLDFNKCKFAFNGYACPSELDDNILDPEKPIEDMKKEDFKDVNKGLETRQDKSNDLLETLISEEAKNAGKLEDAIDGMNNNLGGKLDGIGDGIDTTNENLEGILDSLSPGDGEISRTGNAESWWESRYEDGFAGVWAVHSTSLMQTPLFEFIQQFSISPSGTQPDWDWCFNLGKLGNLGCHQVEVPALIWAFIKLVMLITAGFTARRIIFGG